MKNLLCSLSACLLMAGSTQADVLYKMSTTNGSPTVYDSTKVTIINFANTTSTGAPVADTDGTDGANGLETTRNNSNWNGGTTGGFDFGQDGQADFAAVQSDFSTGFLEFTITADFGYQLDLTTLNFGIGRGGASSTRGYVMYATVNGGAFASTDTPIANVANVADTVLRANPLPTEINLSGATYQGIDSVTFRFYTMTPGNGVTLGFDAMTLNGAVNPVPEPTTLGLLGLGLVGLLFRRNRHR